MKHKRGRLLSVLIAFVLVLSLLPMTAFAEGETGTSVTVGTEESASQYFPTYAYYCYSKTQYIIPASQLADLNGKDLTALTWHMQSAPLLRKVDVYLQETTGTTLQGLVDATGAKQVYNGTEDWTIGYDDTGSQVVLIPFDEAYSYEGGNLLVTVLDNTGTYTSPYNYGFGTGSAESTNYSLSTGTASVAFTDSSAYSLSSTGGNTFNFLPMTTLYAGELPAFHDALPIWVGGKAIVEGATAGDGWEYDPESSTLTLNEPTYTGLYGYALICAGMDVDIKGDVIGSTDDYWWISALDVFNGNVSVTGDLSATGNNEDACGLYMESADEEDTATSATVTGDVTATADDDGYGIYVEYKASTEVTATGNVTATADEDTYGVYTDEDSSAEVTVTGDITASGGYAYGLCAYESEGSFDVDGSITATGNGRGIGISLSQYGSFSEESTENETRELSADVTGLVSASGTHAQGVAVTTYGNGAVVNVKTGAITAKAQSQESSSFSCSAGLYAMNYGGTINAEVNGDIQATEANGLAYGIEIMGMTGSSSCPIGSEGTNTVQVFGDVIADGYGIYYMGETNTAILVEDTIDAGLIGVMLMSYGSSTNQDIQLRKTVSEDAATEEEAETATTEALELTVWKILLNKNGDVAGRMNMSSFFGPAESKLASVQVAQEVALSDLEAVPTEELIEVAAEAAEPEAETEELKYDKAEDFEKENIHYIIKVEQPEEGATLSVTDEEGNDLETSFDYDVAYEGDKVILKVDLEKGFELKAAYNGEGEDKVELEKDEDGNYYTIVPKGGGVILSVELQEIEYTITEGADSTWTKGDTEGVTIVVKRNVDDDTCFDHFTGVEVDGTKVAADNYTAKAGSTVLTFKPAYLEKLSAEKHDVKITYDDGEVSTTLTVKEKETSPKTGDQSRTGLWACLVCISAVAVLGIFVIRKRGSVK